MAVGLNRAKRFSNASPERDLDLQTARGWLPRGYIDGLILANNGDDATNDINIGTGVGRSNSNRINGVISTAAKDQRDIEIDVARIKQLDVVWAPGNGGGRSAESLADGTWHWLGIGGRGLKDDLIAVSDISTSTIVHNALPGGYTAFRYIGSILRSTSIRPFTQLNDWFWLSTPVLDYNNATPGTNAVTPTLSIPLGVKVLVSINSHFTGVRVYFSSPDAADLAPSATAAPLGSILDGGGILAGGQNFVYSNTASQIRFRCATSAQLYIATLGWQHPRGRNA